MTEWLKGCEICNAGLCAKFDELINLGYSQRRAAKELEKEQREILGEVVYPSEALRQRFQYNKNKSGRNSTTKQTYKTCAISDLNKLFELDIKFGTIYADPPWKYSNQGTRSATNNHYKTMTIEEIKCLPINNISADNSHLHLWTTNAFLPKAFEIIESWGFEYKSCFVWVKPQMGIGNYWRVSHEFLLLGVRGKQTFIDKGQKSWREINRGKHSKKPEEIAQTIERVSPGPFLELFGRQTRNGWTVWGNEIERDLFNDGLFSNND